jgi:hypothetical protein
MIQSARSLSPEVTEQNFSRRSAAKISKNFCDGGADVAELREGASSNDEKQ